MATPPESSAAKSTENGEKRSGGVRAKLDLRVDFGTAFDVHTTAYMHNIGTGGVYVKTHNPLEVGEKVELEFTLPENFRTIKAQARVAWSRQEDNDDPIPAGMGLAFTHIQPEDREALHDYVDQLVRKFQK